MKADTRTRYGSISIIFHWGMAFLILWQLLKVFDRIAEGKHWVGETLVPWHVSIGSLLLLLIAARVVWVLTQLGNRPRHRPAEAFLVNAGHFLLYAGMVLMPVTGVLTMIGNGYGWTVFGMELVSRGAKIPWAASVGSLHSPIAWTLLVLIIGHTGIALVHHFVRKDDTLKRII